MLANSMKSTNATFSGTNVYNSVGFTECSTDGSKMGTVEKVLKYLETILPYSQMIPKNDSQERFPRTIPFGRERTEQLWTSCLTTSSLNSPHTAALFCQRSGLVCHAEVFDYLFTLIRKLLHTSLISIHKIVQS